METTFKMACSGLYYSTDKRWRIDQDINRDWYIELDDKHISIASTLGSAKVWVNRFNLHLHDLSKSKENN